MWRKRTRTMEMSQNVAWNVAYLLPFDNSRLHVYTICWNSLTMDFWSWLEFKYALTWYHWHMPIRHTKTLCFIIPTSGFLPQTFYFDNKSKIYFSIIVKMLIKLSTITFIAWAPHTKMAHSNLELGYIILFNWRKLEH
jgi:hypothetical protein